MSTLAESLLPMISQIRAIPGQMGIRPYSVSVVLGMWSGSYIGRGAKVEDEVPIIEANGQPPKVRFVKAEELALGNLQKGSVTVGPITPGFPGGGTTLDQVKPAMTAGQTVHLRITGPEFPGGALYKVTSFSTDHALHYTLTCEPAELGLPP